jgi:hypothetical protein
MKSGNHVRKKLEDSASRQGPGVLGLEKELVLFLPFTVVRPAIPYRKSTVGSD